MNDWCRIKTDDQGTIALGKYDGTSTLGVDLKGIKFEDRVKAVVEGKRLKSGVFETKTLISIEKVAGQ